MWQISQSELVISTAVDGAAGVIVWKFVAETLGDPFAGGWLDKFCFSIRNNIYLVVKSTGPVLQVLVSPITYPGRSVIEWVMFSDFGDSYRIYRACELVYCQMCPG